MEDFLGRTATDPTTSRKLTAVLLCLLRAYLPGLFLGAPSTRTSGSRPEKQRSLTQPVQTGESNTGRRTRNGAAQKTHPNCQTAGSTTTRQHAICPSSTPKVERFQQGHANSPPSNTRRPNLGCHARKAKAVDQSESERQGPPAHAEPSSAQQVLRPHKPAILTHLPWVHYVCGKVITSKCRERQGQRMGQSEAGDDCHD